MASGDLFAGFPPELEPLRADRDRRIFVGTSGYSFADWVGPFYPPGTRAGDFLAHYARHFPAVEVNSTYYRIPPPAAIASMERKTPAGFRFMVKVNQAMTHERLLEPALVRAFRAALAPLKDAGKFDGLLAQFPWGFRRTGANEAHLSLLRRALEDDPLFVEFRHDSWAGADVADRLRAAGLGFCAVDEPALEGLMPPVTSVTAPDAYVRFHGRNARNWWGGRSGGGGTPHEDASRPGGASSRAGSAALRVSGDRYDHDYTPDELKEWVDKVRALASQARRTYLFFNNCHAGQAARSARLMQQLLRQQGLPV
jgi:uncharacterized protein YecE (DUF72 family)